MIEEPQVFNLERFKTFQDRFERYRVLPGSLAEIIGQIRPGTVGRPLRVLDLGCGNLELTGSLLFEGLTLQYPAGFDLTLVDPSPEMLEDARAGLRRHSERIVASEVVQQGAVEALSSLPTASADLILGSHLIYYVPGFARAKLIRECKRCLSNRGVAAFAVRRRTAQLWQVFDSPLKSALQTDRDAHYFAHDFERLLRDSRTPFTSKTATYLVKPRTDDELLTTITFLYRLGSTDPCAGWSIDSVLSAAAPHRSTTTGYQFSLEDEIFLFGPALS